MVSLSTIKNMRSLMKTLLTLKNLLIYYFDTFNNRKDKRSDWKRWFSLKILRYLLCISLEFWFILFYTKTFCVLFNTKWWFFTLFKTYLRFNLFYTFSIIFFFCSWRIFIRLFFNYSWFFLYSWTFHLR